jgi:hypothetical protein
MRPGKNSSFFSGSFVSNRTLREGTDIFSKKGKQNGVESLDQLSPSLPPEKKKKTRESESKQSES